MRTEVENIISDLELAFAGEDYAGHRLRIEEAIKKAEIKYQYHERLSMNPGTSETIKRELAEQNHISISTVKKYVHCI